MIRNAASQRQVDAANPANHTWLSANAGSGKTRVLTDRVARLLLEGVEPQNILCLTYTKAAAAEMQNRLFKRLGAWAMLDDAALLADLRDLGVDRKTDLRDARTLFARAIETPGGLKIQTIHSFCSSILRRFPLEAGVSPQFREMEDRTSELLRADVLDQMVDGAGHAAVLGVLHHFTGAEIAKLVAEVAKHRDAFMAPPTESKLRETLDLSEGLTLDMLLANVFGADEIQTLRAITAICAKGSVSEQNAANKLSKINFDQPMTTDLLVLEDVLLYKDKAKSGPYSAKINDFPTKDTRGLHPELIDSLNIIMETVQHSRVDRLKLNALSRTQALYTFGAHFIPAYEARKTVMGMLDFADLIRKARTLLTDPHVAQWVLFRLDGGIDHVLVDEAQDTSPDQWAVIKHLTAEFVSGEGARANRRRTVFVVGDKKQSIYSFQGADPDEFDRMKAHFDEKLRAAKDQLEVLDLQHSFRSSKAILRVVDDTFADHRGDGLGNAVFHTAFKEDMPGRVDLWPVIAPNEKEDDLRDWFDPVDKTSDAHHNVQLANQIAAEIKRMTLHETIPVEIGNTGTYAKRQVTEGDILILVQRRSDLFAEIIRACKQQELNIAGADRLRVGAELAVRDLAALLNFLGLPEDDFSLACALRSPLFGWTEQDLFTLAHHRPDKTFLWTALRESDAYPQTKAILHDLRKQSDFLRPYDLIERILTRHDGRRKLLARLGSEAEDGIDALLSQALAYEASSVPSLTGFLSWMQTDDLEVKREMDNQGNRIRVMTVHGAKGLESPIVFLPETQKSMNIDRNEIYEIDDLVFWKTKTDEAPPSLVAKKESILAAQERERMRLLYVAMTRAEKWLIIAGAGEVGNAGESWYRIAEEGIERAGDVAAFAGEIPIRRVSHADWDKLALVKPEPSNSSKALPPQFPPLPAIAIAKTLSPSELEGAKILPGDPAGEDKETALAKGRLIHLLLEHLPNAAPADQQALGQKLISASHDYTQEAEQLVSDVISLIAKPDLAPLFTPDTLYEVSITAPLGARRMHGAIDLLQIGHDHILAVDFKSNRLVPDSPETTPEGLLRQMGAYAAGLRAIYPTHRIETAILWTQTATLMRLPNALVSSALNRVTLS